MSEIVHVTTHVDDAVARLIGQYEDRPRLIALITLLAKQVQDIEDAAFDVLVQSALDAAQDNELDVIGNIVGQKRNGSVDAEYRVFLAARIKTNRSDGKYATLSEIAKLILSDAAIAYREYYPSSIVMASDNVSINSFIVWRDFLRRAKGSGKSIQFGFSKQPSTNTIKFGSFYRGQVLASTQRPGSVHSSVYGGGKTAGIYG